MPWVRIDDHFNEHPKLAAVGPVGWGIWLAGLAYCNRNLTDGFIPRAMAFGFGGDWRVEKAIEDDPEHVRRWEIARTSGVGGEDMDSEWVVELLTEYGLWDTVPGGFQVHDYSDYQPTKAQILALRASKAAAGQAGGQASAKARAQANGAAGPPALAQAKSNPIPIPVPIPFTSTPAIDDYIEPWMLFEERTKRKASQKVRDWLEDLHARFSRKELIGAMMAMPDPRSQDWLKKVDAYLEGRP